MINKASIVVGWLTMFVTFIVLGLTGNELWKFVFSATLVLGVLAFAVRSPR